MQKPVSAFLGLVAAVTLTGCQNDITAPMPARISMAPSSAITFDPATGLGFVGKGDVQYTFGWNNAQLQSGAAGLMFQVNRVEVSEVSWTCHKFTGPDGAHEVVQQRSRITTTSTQGVVAHVVRERAHRLQQRGLPARRAARGRAEARRARDAHRRPHGVGRRRLEVAVRVLDARLAERPARDLPALAEHDGVVDVVEVARGARSAETARPARAGGVDAVEAVAQAQLVRARAVVELREAERRGDGVRVEVPCRRRMRPVGGRSASRHQGERGCTRSGWPVRRHSAQ